jgi:hypothetical protein
MGGLAIEGECAIMDGVDVNQAQGLTVAVRRPHAAGRSPSPALPGWSWRDECATQPIGVHLHVLGLKRHPLGAAQRAGEAEQQQRRSRLPRAVRSQVAAAA